MSWTRVCAVSFVPAFGGGPWNTNSRPPSRTRRMSRPILPNGPPPLLQNALVTRNVGGDTGTGSSRYARLSDLVPRANSRIFPRSTTMSKPSSVIPIADLSTIKPPSWAPSLGGRVPAAALRAARPHGVPRLQQPHERVLVEHGHTELLGLRQLRARILARDDVVRLLRDATGHLGAPRLERRLGLLAGKALEAAGEHDGDARERLLLAGRARDRSLEVHPRRPELLDHLEVPLPGEELLDALGQD